MLFKGGYSLADALELILWVGDRLLTIESGNLFLDFLDVLQLRIFCIILRKNARILLLKFIQSLAACIRRQGFITRYLAEFLKSAFVFFLSRYDFLLLFLIGFIGFFQKLGFGFHADHGRYYAGDQRGHQNVRICKHRGVQHLLRACSQ